MAERDDAGIMEHAADTVRDYMKDRKKRDIFSGSIRRIELYLAVIIIGGGTGLGGSTLFKEVNAALMDYKIQQNNKQIQYNVDYIDENRRRLQIVEATIPNKEYLEQRFKYQDLQIEQLQKEMGNVKEELQRANTNAYDAKEAAERANQNIKKVLRILETGTNGTGAHTR